MISTQPSPSSPRSFHLFLGEGCLFISALGFFLPGDRRSQVKSQSIELSIGIHPFRLANKQTPIFWLDIYYYHYYTFKTAVTLIFFRPLVELGSPHTLVPGVLRLQSQNLFRPYLQFKLANRPSSLITGF